jgi:hypothetical protein
MGRRCEHSARRHQAALKCRVVQDVTLLTTGPLSFQRYKRAVQGIKVESRTIDGVGESGFLVR